MSHSKKILAGVASVALLAAGGGLASAAFADDTQGIDYKPGISDDTCVVTAPDVPHAVVTLTVATEDGSFSKTLAEGESVDAPATAYYVSPHAESVDEGYTFWSDDEKWFFTGVGTSCTPQTVYLSDNDVRPAINEEQAAPRTITFPEYPGANLTYVVTDQGGAVFEYAPGTSAYAPESDFSVTAVLSGPENYKFEYLTEEPGVQDDTHKTFYFHAAHLYLNARPDFDETSADRIITFPELTGADVEWTVTAGGTSKVYKEGESVTAPTSAFSVTAKIVSDEPYTFLESEGPWEYAAAPVVDNEKLASATVWFDQNENGNVFRVDPVEGVHYFFTEEDPANDNWTAVRDEWADDELTAPACGVFTVRAVADKGYYVGMNTDENGNLVKEYTADWSHDFGECATPTEEPSVEPTDEPTAEVTTPAAQPSAAAAETKSTDKLAKTGINLGLGVVAAGLIGTGALLARRRTA